MHKPATYSNASDTAVHSTNFFFSHSRVSLYFIRKYCIYAQKKRNLEITIFFRLLYTVRKFGQRRTVWTFFCELLLTDEKMISSCVEHSGSSCPAFINASIIFTWLLQNTNTRFICVFRIFDFTESSRWIIFYLHFVKKKKWQIWSCNFILHFTAGKLAGAEENGLFLWFFSGVWRKNLI